MKRSTLVLALAGLALVPALAGAQERQPREERPRTAQPFSGRMFTYNNSNRARLGVTLTLKGDPDTDKYGAKIQDVLPDGPAEKAGLKPGDIITRFNGTSLANASASEDEQSGPGRKLIELAQALDPGDSVKIDYRRDGQARSTTVVAAEVEPTMFSGNFGPQEFKVMPRFEGPEGGDFEMMTPGQGMSFFFDRGGFGGLDLVELNSDLGEYFGTSEGLLVTSTPEDSSSVLRAGDVILSIDGRKPSSVSQAGRILGSYENGETAKLEIMRKHQRITVDWKVNRPEMRMRQMLPGRAMEHTQHM
ncbi:MAG TPA: PDZ domain-containing protein [Gemmatimonadales bacterium]|jgi:S1-C subfamily serine protease|nr:PDZ domain-containing protein [Gemmatimonadales bacterium]